jgi:type I restriction enzyme, S subunit
VSLDDKLPKGWAWTTLGNVGIWSGGGTPSKGNRAFWAEGDVPWVSPKDMKVLRIADTEDHISTRAVAETNVKPVPIGTILVVVRSGILERTLPVAVAQVPVTMNQDMKGITPADGIDSMYVAYYLIGSERDVLSRCSKDGTTVASIDSESLRAYPIALPPSAEQWRIVAAIEQHFTRLDEGAASLRRAQAHLKRYRAAVLKAAVEGKLTEAWRAEHPAEESASALLASILAERRARWEADLQAKGKDPAKARYQEPDAPDTANLPELPEGWAWATVEQLGAISEQAVLTGPFGSNLGRDDFVASGVPVLTIGCLTKRGLSLDKAFYVSESKASELERYRVKAGDLLFSRMASVGRAELVTAQFEGSVVNYHLMRLRLLREAINPLFFVSYVRGASSVVDYVRDVNHGATRDGINTDQLLAMPIALPPVSEQEQIVADDG